MADAKLDMSLVGMKFYTTKDARKVLANSLKKKALPVTLIREPDNPSDGNAIKVVATGRGALKGKQLGHVPAAVAEVLAPMIDRGEVVVTTANLDGIDLSKDTGSLVVNVVKDPPVRAIRRKK